MSSEAPRMPPVPREQWPPQMGSAMAAMRPPTVRHEIPPRGGRPDRPQALGLLGTFAHHPDLAQAWLGFNGHILYGTTLTIRQREILVLRAAALLESTYGWAQHVVHKDEAGLSDMDIARIAFGPESPFLDPLERAMLRAVDELLGDGAIGEATWETLAEHFDERQLLDLIFTVGTYTVLDWVADSIGLELESDLPCD